VSVPKDTEINTDEAVREAMQRQIRVDIGLLNSSSTPEQIGAIIDHIGSAGLDDVTGDSLLTTIKAQTRTPIGPLRSQLKDVIKNRRKKARAARPAVPGLTSTDSASLSRSKPTRSMSSAKSCPACSRLTNFGRSRW
jgi:hypothetical protein